MCKNVDFRRMNCQKYIVTSFIPGKTISFAIFKPPQVGKNVGPTRANVLLEFEKGLQRTFKRWNNVNWLANKLEERWNYIVLQRQTE